MAGQPVLVRSVGVRIPAGQPFLSQRRLLRTAPRANSVTRRLTTGRLLGSGRPEIEGFFAKPFLTRPGETVTISGAFVVARRLMAGQLVLVQSVGVRIPAGQPPSLPKGGFFLL